MLERLLRVALLVLVAGGLAVMSHDDKYYYTTADGYYCCYAGSCIPDTWLCDGYIDCPYGEDEESCYDITDETTVYPATTTTSTTTTALKDCPASFEMIGGRCVMVEPFATTSWDEARYLCEMFNADILVIDSLDFYRQVLEFIDEKGLVTHDYWIGGTDREVEGNWTWVSGEPMLRGTPLWALYYSYSYEQEPQSSDASSQDCAFLDQDRFYYVASESCGTEMAVICQVPTWPALHKDAQKHRLSPQQRKKIQELYHKIVEEKRDLAGQHLSPKMKGHPTKIKQEEGDSHMKKMTQGNERSAKDVSHEKAQENGRKQGQKLVSQNAAPQQKLRYPKTEPEVNNPALHEGLKQMKTLRTLSIPGVKTGEDSSVVKVKDYIAKKDSSVKKEEDSSPKKAEDSNTKKAEPVKDKPQSSIIQNKATNEKHKSIEKARANFDRIRSK